jgi:hypothetical protein
VSNFVRMFQPRFAALVEAGRKRQTVRPVPRRMPRAGDTISLRAWSGKPYRSPQRVLAVAMITQVRSCELRALGGPLQITLGGVVLDADRAEEFARADGFADLSEMHAWFLAQHGLPFAGIVIYWREVAP